MAILEVGHDALGGLLQRGHEVVGRLTQLGDCSHGHLFAHRLLQIGVEPFLRVELGAIAGQVGDAVENGI